MATSIVPGRLTGFGGVNPILRVIDLQVSKDYYTRVLRFEVDFETPGFISVSRGKCGLFLCEGDQGHLGSWVWISAPDVELLVEELRRAGARSVMSRRTIRGRWKSRSKIRMATFCAGF